MCKWVVTYLIIFISFQLIGQEKEQHYFLSGYVKNLNEISFMDNLMLSEYTGLLHNRINFRYQKDVFKIRLEFRNRLYYGKGVRNEQGFSEIIGADNGLVDLSLNLIEEDHFLFNTSIDRALVNFSEGKWDITIGRQRVNWGMNLAWNPNDIFNTYNLLDFDYEERPGSDAIRVQYYPGDFDKLEIAVKKGRSGSDIIGAILYKFNKWSYDIQVFSGLYQKDWVSGIGWAGNLKEAGFKGEMTYFVPFENYYDSQNTLSTSISVDYVFQKGLFVNGSVLYNSAANEYYVEDLGGLVYDDLSAKNLMPFIYSYFLQLSKEINPIMNWNFSTIYSGTRQSVIFMPSFNYSLSNNWNFSLIAQSFFEFENYDNIGNRIIARLHFSF